MPEFRFKDLVRHSLLDRSVLKVVVMPEPDSDGWINAVSVELSGEFRKPPTEEEFAKWIEDEKIHYSNSDGYRPSHITLVAHEDNWWIDNHGELGYNAQDQD